MDSKGIEGTALLHNWHVSTLCMYLHLGHLLMKQLELATSRIDHTLGYAIVQVMHQQLIMVVSLFYFCMYMHTVYTCTVI